MSDEGPKISTGRLGRLARLASMGARLSTDVVSRGVKRLRNADADDLSALGPAAAEKLVATLGELKGLAMKMGQQMSMDPDLLTPEVRAVISRLQNQAPPMPYAQVQQVIFEQLKAAPHEVFASFDEKPMASASLGQVHRAVTRAGLAVAVKIQYPDIAKALESDLNNMSSMVTVLGAATRVGHAKSYFNEFKDSLTDELDYRAEAQRADVFRTACTALPLLVVPQVEHSLTAEKVLTMELLTGPTLKEFLNNKTASTPNDEPAAGFEAADSRHLGHVSLEWRHSRRPAPGQLHSSRRWAHGHSRLRSHQETLSPVSRRGAVHVSPDC